MNLVSCKKIVGYIVLPRVVFLFIIIEIHNEIRNQLCRRQSLQCFWNNLFSKAKIAYFNV